MAGIISRIRHVSKSIPNIPSPWERDRVRSKRLDFETTRLLKASTLPEALAAMAISVVCMGIGAGIYFNVLQGDNGAQKLRAHLLLDNLADETKQQHLFLNEEEKLQGFSIKKTIEAYPGAENLFVLNLIATDDLGRNIGEHRELLLKEGKE